MKCFKICLLVFTTVFVGIAVFGQVSDPSQYKAMGLPYFEANILATISKENGQRLSRVNVQLINDFLTFVKVDSGFLATVQIDILLTDNKDDFGLSRILNKTVFTDDYVETNSPDEMTTFTIEAEVPPGEYEARITVLDKNSDKLLTRKFPFRVNSYEDAGNDFVVSDVLFFDEFTSDDSGKILNFKPNLTYRFSDDKNFIYAYFSTFNLQEDDPLTIHYLVKDDRGIVIQQNQYQSATDSKYLEHFVRLNRYYFNRQKYVMEVLVTRHEEQVSTQAGFQFYWKYVPNTVHDLDLAIRQLRYIANEDSIKHYLKTSFKEKKAFFERFWDERDPNPETEVNELSVEYYRRINYAVENFSATGREGWLTDRGRIYVKFGQPDDLERHPFEAQTYPYEIWRYYAIRKNFVFIDRTGFGDYVLHPSYYTVEFE